MFPRHFNPEHILLLLLHIFLTGTGKTLVARALANECSVREKRVAFFMRKGADSLSKWVGESERQLRLLFDQVSFNYARHSNPSTVNTFATFRVDFPGLPDATVDHLLRRDRRPRSDPLQSPGPDPQLHRVHAPRTHGRPGQSRRDRGDRCHKQVRACYCV